MAIDSSSCSPSSSPSSTSSPPSTRRTFASASKSGSPHIGRPARSNLLSQFALQFVPEDVLEDVLEDAGRGHVRDRGARRAGGVGLARQSHRGGGLFAF